MEMRVELVGALLDAAAAQAEAAVASIAVELA
jgi:hypothetical protein